MSADVTTLFVSQFTTNVQMLLQQKDSRLSGSVMIKQCQGKQQAAVDQYGSVTPNKRTVRNPPVTHGAVPTDRRWVYPVDYDWSDLIDNADKLRMLTDPQSAYVQAATYAMNRAKDDEIITAFWGTAKTGETGGTSTSFLAANQIANNFGAGAAVGLTVAKLKQAIKILRGNEVDPDEQLYCAITAKQEEDLLNEIQVINLDYNSRPVLVDGRVRRFMGIDFIPCERLVTDGTYRRIPVWPKSAMCLGIWQDVNVAVTQRNDLAGSPHPWQVYICGTFGATRTEEKKIVEIKCSES